MLCLNTTDDRTDQELMRSQEGEPIDRTKLPLLMISTDTLIDSARYGDPLTPNLILTNRWRCVYLDPQAAVFVSEEFAVSENLPPANTGYLQSLLSERRIRY